MRLILGLEAEPSEALSAILLSSVEVWVEDSRESCYCQCAQLLTENRPGVGGKNLSFGV